ncbi:butyrophilin subfamily 3 member A2-like [Seriola lalandi dorsalis]|uniref:butyrophilin subfamily 3 member A2-like n=1 Tax=Seriola lalandi dorsalis TaxID=1841481 RepID=UPI000C6FC270|nr:butyrophilin subfamily 3 member A2-like [Seriola lalandi dorsalis]
MEETKEVLKRGQRENNSLDFVFFKGESSVFDPAERVLGPEKVLAFAGRDVTLTCTFNITDRGDLPTVEWSKDDLEPNVIFLYRDGCETHEMKNPDFEYRTSFVMKNLKHGDISLRISNVRLSDAGRYQCMRLWKNAPKDITKVELNVVSMSEPKLSVVPHKTGGVTLQCEARSWLPEPKIMFLDDRGNDLPAKDPETHQDESGCHSVRRQVTLQTATSRVICRAHQLEFNRSADVEILILGDCTGPCSCTTEIAATGATVFAITALACGLAFLLWRRCDKAADTEKLPVTRQESGESSVSGASENQLLLVQREQADSIQHLRSELCEKNKTIIQLQNDLKSLVVCQHSQPTLVPSRSSQMVQEPLVSSSLETSISPSDHNPPPSYSSISNPPGSAIEPQNKHQKPRLQRQYSVPASARPIQKTVPFNSSPAFSSFDAEAPSSSSSVVNPGRIGRSMSVCSAQPAPKHLRSRQRHSIAFPLSPSFNSHYSPLTDVNEE